MGGGTGRALSGSAIPSVRFLSQAHRRGSSPFHSWHTMVLGGTQACAAEVPCPHLNLNLCPRENSVPIAFVFSYCPPGNPTLWQEMASCSLAEVNQGLCPRHHPHAPPGLGWGQSHQNGMAAVLECWEGWEDAGKQMAKFITLSILFNKRNGMQIKLPRVRKPAKLRAERGLRMSQGIIHACGSSSCPPTG